MNSEQLAERLTIDAPLLADRAAGAALVIVRRADHRVRWQAEEPIADAAIEGLAGAALKNHARINNKNYEYTRTLQECTAAGGIRMYLEIRAPAASDQQGVAGEHL